MLFHTVTTGYSEKLNNDNRQTEVNNRQLTCCRTDTSLHTG